MRYFSEGGFPLRYARKDDAGIDLPFYDKDNEEIIIMPGETRKIKTGIHLEIPAGHAGILDTRSSSGEIGIDLMCRVIDAGYRGNIRLMIINHSDKPITIYRGMYVAQIVITKLCEDRDLSMVSSPDTLSYTDRGEEGFGSTGMGFKR